jgi:2-polyprenyl-6-methoxyphenol hydroxylase-like FAD-dependent oxidoreductase
LRNTTTGRRRGVAQTRACGRRGIGGLGAGAALAQRGAEVEIVEINPTHEVLGVGINQPANSLRALRAIGVLDECIEAGFQFDRARFCDASGNLIVEVPSRLGGDVPANNALTRPDLQHILLAAVDRAGAKIRRAVTVSDLRQDGDRVHVDFTEGDSAEFDLVVAFDGIKSAMRRRLFGPGHEPVFTGFGVWRVTFPRPAEVTCSCIFQGIGAKPGVIPLNAREMYMFLVTPEPGQPRHDPGRFDVLVRERMAGFTGLPGELRDSISGPEGIVYSPLSEVMLPLPWHQGRVVVLGDAAHACAPHITQGAGMALEDAVVLAELLGTGMPVEQALSALGERRWQRCKLVQDASHQILVAEMSITAETLPGAIRQMRAELPRQMAHVDAVLNQPA